jgi:hypothetical protein
MLVALVIAIPLIGFPFCVGVIEIAGRVYDRFFADNGLDISRAQDARDVLRSKRVGS